MYFRKFGEPPKKIIQNAKAKFGAFFDVPPYIDIRGMRAPYAGVPVPSFLSNIRIKSNLSYAFCLEDFIGLTFFFDFKVFGLGEIIFWNKKTGKKYSYHTIMTTRRRFVPNSTTRGICACYQKSRFLKISWGRQHKHHAMTFKVKGDSVRPSSQGYFYSQTKDDFHNDVLFVNPSPTSSRCTATWINTTKINGHIAINNEQVDDSDGIASMILNRSYYKVHTKITMLYGLGKINEKNIVLYLQNSNLDAADSDSFNSNVLFVNEEKTALPPVYITHPFGTEKKWIIQDTENMIDLSFTPINISKRALNLIALKTTTKHIFGTFDGVLLTNSGEKIILKNFYGILYKNLLRL